MKTGLIQKIISDQFAGGKIIAQLADRWPDNAGVRVLDQHLPLIHVHMLFLDGVYIGRSNGRPLSFRRVRAPTSDELVKLTHSIASRVARHLERQGLLERDLGNIYFTPEATPEAGQSN